MRRFVLLSVLTSLALGCVKIPISDIAARFDLADAAWFADEETLFIFYEVSAEQGLSDSSVVEVTYRTDDREVAWTPVESLALVHTHVPVDCGAMRRCGSVSLHVPQQPRDVAVRLRYHVDGALSLNAGLVYNVVGSGPPHNNRSFLVYGVFTRDNRRIQWRGRHRFPTLRNEQVEGLGLRRAFRVETQRYGTGGVEYRAGNVYGYAAGCPAGYTDTDLEPVSTEDRAVFNGADLPQMAAPEAQVCADVVVHEPREPFVTTAMARKNPEVEPAFPVLRSPVRDATPIKFYLAPCNRTISVEHGAMQRQRILFGDGPTRCIDDWRSPGFVDELAREFRDAIDDTRRAGRDMVLVVGLHRDEAGVADLLEEALVAVLPGERDRSTPRVVGGFVFDSEVRDISDEQLSRLVLWCPAPAINDDDPAPSPSRVSCAIIPDIPMLNFGPLSFSAIPILPTRRQYLNFIDQYSEGQAGRVTSLQFLAPEFTTTTDNTDLGGAVATFFNGEIITAEVDDAFSYCAEPSNAILVYRSEVTQSPQIDCPEEGPVDGEFCLPEPVNFIEIQQLPQWHRQVQEQTYELGLVWDFPWLLRANYEIRLAASASAFGLSVPFGFGSDERQDLGTEVWQSSEFPLADQLAHCRRFCDHPTFDSAGVYGVSQLFRDAYLNACYRPEFPKPGDSSFPRDP